MSRISRVFQALFGDTGAQSHFGQFGSRANGTPLQTKDPAAIQALSAFTNNGWTDAVNAANKAPFLEDMNGLFFLAFRQLAYILQDGIPEYDGSTPYFIGSIVRKAGTFEQYGSLTNSNVGNALPSQSNSAYWQYLNPASVAPGIVADWAAPSAPFGWLTCDGSVYAQSSFPALYSVIGSTWNTFNGLSSPSSGYFRVPNLQGVATIGAGAGSGLSTRTLGQFIGEENHILTVPEMPTHSHAPSPVTCNVGQAISTVNNGSGSAVSVGTSNAQLGIQSSGGGGAHNNMQPSAVLGKIIKF